MSDSRGVPKNDLASLEEVEDEDCPGGVSAAGMLGVLLVVLLGAALIAGTFFWVGRQGSAPTLGGPELIRAPAGPSKTRPPDPGGLNVVGESETPFDTSAGQGVDAQLDTTRLPQPASAQAPAPPAEAAEQSKQAPSGARGSVVQLGAFRNTAHAERAWSALTARFPTLGGLSKIVVPYSAGGSSGYRLRAAASSPAEAQQVCRAFKAGGESCFIPR